MVADDFDADVVVAGFLADALSDEVGFGICETEIDGTPLMAEARLEGLERLRTFVGNAVRPAILHEFADAVRAFCEHTEDNIGSLPHDAPRFVTPFVCL